MAGLGQPVMGQPVIGQYNQQPQAYPQSVYQNQQPQAFPNQQPQAFPNQMPKQAYSYQQPQQV